MEQLNKKELYEQKKQQKFEVKETQRKEQKKSRALFALSVGVPLLIVALAIFYAIYASSGAAIPDIGENFVDQGREHIQPGAEHPPYNSNPPTSGWHYDAPADWGVYKEELPQEQLIHNLEHGGIVIQYRTDIDPEIQEKLEELKNSEFECKLVVAPNDNLEKLIALSAWTRLYTSDAFDEETVKNFIRKYRSSGPEGFVPCSAGANHGNQ